MKSSNNLIVLQILSVIKEVPFDLNTVQRLRLHWKLLKCTLIKNVQ